jgi:hypothetical protein
VGAKSKRRGKHIHLGYYESEEAAARRAGGELATALQRMRGARAHGPAWGAYRQPSSPPRLSPSAPKHPRVYDRAAIAFHKRDADLNVRLGGLISSSGAADACWAARTCGAADHQPGPACPTQRR